MERYLGAALVLGVAANELFHAIFDGLAFSSSVESVSQVLAMKQTWDPDSWRAINSSFVATIAYSVIWLAHAASGTFSLYGAFLVFKSRGDAGRLGGKAYSIAVAGVGIGAMLYFIGMVAIAGGWFLLYSAPTPPNFITEAVQLFLCYMAVIFFLILTRR